MCGLSCLLLNFCLRLGGGFFHGLGKDCMPYPRHALQSVEIPAVTQVRASDDYVPNSRETTQWHMGDSSMLAHALGLAPFKDNWWSSSSQPGSSVGLNTEPNPPTQVCLGTSPLPSLLPFFPSSLFPVFPSPLFPLNLLTTTKCQSLSLRHVDDNEKIVCSLLPPHLPFHWGLLVVFIVAIVI